MNTTRLLFAACAGLCVLLAGCATLVVPRGGRVTVKIVEGGFVENVRFVGAEPLNIQITEQDVPAGEALFPHVLTIGKFSPVAGSGFTRRSNIYYESRIAPQGQATFSVGSDTYRVTWNAPYGSGWPDPHSSVFVVTLEHIGWAEPQRRPQP
ncbi:MAG: hypothetical protein JXR37_31505 [Kiritimatiellae bacterium]|nr:hypothetical protein [Kiritimatiellia bacterium]